MKRLVGYLLLSVLVLTLVGTVVVAIPPAAAVSTANNFLSRLAPCVVDHGDPVPVNEVCLPAGCYCMYYSDDPAWAPDGSHHGFGWSPCKLKCGALYQLVEEPTSTCCFNQVTYHAAHEVVPPSPGTVFQIPPTFGSAGFYLNMPDPHPYTQGLYFTDTSRNQDGIRHAWIFEVEYKPGECKCQCHRPGDSRVIPNIMYVLVWEDWCGGGDGDWNDFVVALIPVTCPCQ